ncbi:MAG: 50S ribosomal protein L25/general stress protein Ctc [Propionibacteriaceae bacterium]
MSEIKLDGVARNEFGKGAARRLRRENMIPAVIYGHGTDPVHIALPQHVTTLALRQANVLLDINVDGGTSILALPKQVQKDPIKNTIEHVDLLLVKRGEKVTVDVQVNIVGEAVSGSQINHDMNSMSIEADASNIPTEIEVSIEGLEVGTQILAGDVVLPAGATLAGDPEALVVGIVNPAEQNLEVPVNDGTPAATPAGDAE